VEERVGKLEKKTAELEVRVQAQQREVNKLSDWVRLENILRFIVIFLIFLSLVMKYRS
jgi:hypothetical protein